MNPQQSPSGPVIDLPRLFAVVPAMSTVTITAPNTEVPIPGLFEVDPTLTKDFELDSALAEVTYTGDVPIVLCAQIAVTMSLVGGGPTNVQIGLSVDGGPFVPGINVKVVAGAGAAPTGALVTAFSRINPDQRFAAQIKNVLGADDITLESLTVQAGQELARV